MLRVVLDVNVLISGAIRKSSVPGRVLSAWRTGQFEVLVSTQLLGELRDVLGRSQLARFVTPSEAWELVAELEASAIDVDDPPVVERVVPHDPDDDFLVALARAGRAHVIVTDDADLFDADVSPPARSPRDFLAWLAKIEELM